LIKAERREKTLTAVQNQRLKHYLTADSNLQLEPHNFMWLIMSSTMQSAIVRIHLRVHAANLNPSEVYYDRYFIALIFK